MFNRVNSHPITVPAAAVMGKPEQERGLLNVCHLIYDEF
jgi:hypothetical protein